MKEQVVIDALQAHVRSAHPHCWVVKIFADGMQGRGTLDLIGSYCYNGTFYPFNVDAKRPGGTISLAQELLVKQAKRTGYVAGIVDSVDDFIELFKERRGNG